MSIQLPGYQFNEIIYESSYSVVYRGLWERAEGTQQVILKGMREEYPPPEFIGRFKREYNIIRRLNLPGIAQAYALEKYKNGLIMVLEDFGGHSLAGIMATRRFIWEEFLPLALQITRVLGDIHRRQDPQRY
jgi:serine/threonine protein kinase